MLALCTCLLGSALPAQGASADLPAWAQEDYALIRYRKIQLRTGYEPTQRGTFVRALLDALAYALPKSLQVTMEDEWVIPKDYFADAGVYDEAPAFIAYGLLEGTVEADGKRYARLGDTITREQAAKLVCTTLDVTAQRLQVDLPLPGETLVYTDQADISGWALEYTSRIGSYGLMKGDERGNFNPKAMISPGEVAVLLRRTSDLMYRTALASLETAGNQVLAGSKLDWVGINNAPSTHDPLDALGYYNPNSQMVRNSDGTLSAVHFPAATVDTATETLIAPAVFYVESYSADGKALEVKEIPFELDRIGCFLQGKDYFYVAFGRTAYDETVNQEVVRIVQYDKNWNRVDAVSYQSLDTNFASPFYISTAQMAESADGKYLTLSFGVQGFVDPAVGMGHQYSCFIRVKTDGMVDSPIGSTTASHTGSNHVLFDGDNIIRANHSDAFPVRGFYISTILDHQAELPAFTSVTPMTFAGDGGDNTTNACASGLAVSDTSVLYLAATSNQETADWQRQRLVLFTIDKADLYNRTVDTPISVKKTWVTDVRPDDGMYRVQSWPDWGEPLDTAYEGSQLGKLIKIDNDTFAILYAPRAGGVRVVTVDGEGNPKGEAVTYPWADLPTSDPVVEGRSISWIHLTDIGSVDARLAPAQTAPATPLLIRTTIQIP